MRNHVSLFILLAAVSACAARTSTSTLAKPVPRYYSCGDLELVRMGDQLMATEATADSPMLPTGLGFRDDAGDHFVSFPTSPTDVQAIEYLMPHDSHADAIERIYDTSRGTSRVDWQMTRQRNCKAEGGYTDAFTRWVGGDSYDKVATDLSLAGTDEAKDLVHEALVRANKRFYRR
jgi:hypothetical protein